MATADTQRETKDFISVHLAQLINLYNDNIENVKLLYGKLCDFFLNSLRQCVFSV